MAEAAEAGDDFVEDQQDAVLVADFAQALEIALGRRQHAGGTGHGFDDDRRDGRGIMQGHEAFQLVGQMAAPFRLAAGEGLFLAVVGVRQVIDTRQHGAEPLAVGDHAAHRDAAEVHAVIAALAADQAGAAGLAVGAVIGQRDLQRRVGGLGSGVAEEGVVQIAGRHGGEARGQFEHLGMTELEGRREVQFGGRLLDRRDDGLAAVAGVGAPEPRAAVENRPAGQVVIVHVLGPGDHARALLEGPVGREAHPERLEIVRRRFPGGGTGEMWLVHRIALLE